MPDIMSTSKIKKVLIALIFSLPSVLLNAGEEFSKKELIMVHDKAVLLIQNYQNTINQLGNEIADIDKTKGNIEKFIDLFVNRKTLVYNDLDPAHQLSEYYEIETYATNLPLWYPDGQIVSVDLEQAKVSNIIEHGESIYSIDVVVEKSINGNYINKTVNNNKEKLLFRIVFVMENQKPGKFKIAGIRNATSEIKPMDNLSIVEVKSADLSKNDILKIEQNSRSIINDYVNYFSLLGSASESAEDKEFYKTSLKNIFSEGDNNVYNDLEEKPEDKYLSIDEYLLLYSDLYPVINNLSVNVDSASFSKVIKNDDGKFNVYMYASKFFSGKAKGKGLYRFQDKMIIKISFTRQNESFGNFKIISIDNAGMNEALASSKAQTQSISSFGTLNKLTREGWYISFHSNAGFAKILNQNIADLEMSKNSHEWDIKQKLTYGMQLRVLNMFNDFMGIETGIGYQSYKTTYSLSSQGQVVNQTMVDSAGLEAFVAPYNMNSSEQIYKIIQVPYYDSAVNIQAITIPLYFNMVFGNPGKITFNIKAGIEAVYAIKSNYSVSGQAKYFIYLPNPNIAEKNFHFFDPEDDWSNDLGLYNKTIEKTDMDANLKKVSFNGVISAGVEVPLGYFLSVNAGIFYKTGILDLSKSKEDYRDIFGQTELGYSASSGHVFAHKPVKLQQYLLEIGIKYKF